MSEPLILLLRAPVEPVVDSDFEDATAPVGVTTVKPAEEPQEPPREPVALADPVGHFEAAEVMAKAGVPVRLMDPERPVQSYLVGPDLADPGIWRRTTLIDGEPFEDAEFGNATEAFFSALQLGGVPDLRKAEDLCELDREDPG